MKFAIHEFKYTEIKDKDIAAIAEVIIPYTNQFNAIKAIDTYKSRYRIIFTIDFDLFMTTTREVLTKELSELHEICENIAFVFPLPVSIGIPNSILHPDFAPKTFQEVKSLYALGFRETYITGSLAASVDDLAEIHKLMKIRMIPNTVQTDALYFGNPGGISPYESFWLRPEAISIYEELVDVMEFAVDDTHNELGLLSIYNSGSWTGLLGDIIIDETGELNNIPNVYDEVIDDARSRCGLKCQRDDGCHVCAHIKLEAQLFSIDGRINRILDK